MFLQQELQVFPDQADLVVNPDNLEAGVVRDNQDQTDNKDPEDQRDPVDPREPLASLVARDHPARGDNLAPEDPQDHQEQAVRWENLVDR